MKNKYQAKHLPSLPPQTQVDLAPVSLFGADGDWTYQREKKRSATLGKPGRIFVFLFFSLVRSVSICSKQANWC